MDSEQGRIMAADTGAEDSTDGEAFHAQTLASSGHPWRRPAIAGIGFLAALVVLAAFRNSKGQYATLSGGMSLSESERTCTEKGSLGKCEQCMDSEQCGEGRSCCPSMRKCVLPGTDRCYGPWADCSCQMIWDSRGMVEDCDCANKDFPDNWQLPTCSANGGPEEKPTAEPEKEKTEPSCIDVGSLGKCDKCMQTEQCGSGRTCDATMRMCVLSGEETCDAASADCTCKHVYDGTGYVEDCDCKNPDFPENWQLPTCAAPEGKDGKAACIEEFSLGKCENCITNDQCGEGRYCCPYMKKCVKGRESCHYPIADCRGYCSDPQDCNCANKDFPDEWQLPTCKAPEEQTTTAEPTPEPEEEDCVEYESLHRCEPCLVSTQCEGDLTCCPYMKRCVSGEASSSSTTSSPDRRLNELECTPSADCEPGCLDEDAEAGRCTCKNPDFPDKWQKKQC